MSEVPLDLAIVKLNEYRGRAELEPLSVHDLYMITELQMMWLAKEYSGVEDQKMRDRQLKIICERDRMKKERAAQLERMTPTGSG